ncbi:MAG TPA: MerR family transcriptional regulator [Candidatus Baltobacteraceae bacterium]|nr:MerR family transcriptional regulator [Candidatus Baltobacteraceae bacterium]
MEAMEAAGKQYYRAKEFAQRAGVTVRTLHFYDRLGLLSPSGRTESGYRLYCEADLERLEQILALRFVRFRLDHIKKLLGGPPQPLVDALRMQREIVSQEQQRLQVAMEAIDKAHEVLAQGEDGEQRWEAVRRVIEAFKMKDDYSWMDRYYTPEQQAQLAQTRETLGEEGMKKGQQDWADLIAEVEAAASGGVDPASTEAQALNKRWCDLVAQFTQGDPGVHAGLQKMYNDESNWPASFKRPWSDSAQAFLDKVRAAK